jgi:hypothetical protein
MTDKIPCQDCQAPILQTTADSNNGLCWPCRRGGRKAFEAAKVAAKLARSVAQERRRRYDTLVLDLGKLSDAHVIEKLELTPALADEDDPLWDMQQYWHSTADVFLALSDVSRDRRLRPAIRLLLERACHGDPGEIMRGLRHSLEAIATPDWTYLADICLELAESPRKGTRFWRSISSQYWTIPEPSPHLSAQWRPTQPGLPRRLPSALAD